jgi:gliding motility-associated-like protein
MKNSKFILFFILTFFVGLFASAQVGNGSSCVQANCTSGGTYPSIIGQPSMGTYGCLYSTPNPYWVAINVVEPGNIHLTLTQNSDIDFAAYGPFSSVSAGCPITSSTPQVDCSYSSSGTESIDISNVLPGQVYIILITNYSGNAGNYNLTPQPSNSATINCDINFGGTATSTPALCGTATGSVSVTPNGGYAPYTYVWNNIPGNPTTPAVSNVAPGTYNVTITSSPNPVTGYNYNPTTVSVTVANNTPTFTATSTQAACNTGTNGTATANYSGAPAGLTATYAWSPSGQTTQTATGLSPGTHTCTVTLSNGCVGTATTTVGYATVNASATATQVSCPGGSDGTATATLSTTGTLSFLWNDVAGQTTQTAVGLAAGSYTCTISSSVGCTKTATVTVAEIPGMQANFTTISDVTCHSKNDGVLAVSVTQGTAPYTYSWNHSTSTGNSANDLYVGAHTVTITDSKGCVISRTQELTEPNPLVVSYITPSTQICPEANILLTATAAGGSSPYIYTWKLGNEILGTGNSITVDPLVTNTTYCVEVTEECGSPMADSCVLIYFPTPIPPVLYSEYYVDCLPGEFLIENVSPNKQEIATTYYDFGNNTNAIVPNGDTVSVIYPTVGMYSVQVINTSIYGCVYDTTLTNFFEVTPVPTAKFYVAPNPTTIFETHLNAHDLSSNDVVQWDWYSPNSSPSTSTLQHPKFFFPEGVEGTYPVTLIVTSYHGCIDTATMTVVVEDAILFYAPNAFTPDGDEFNQTWEISMKGGDFYGFNLQIFNRWGEIIWETNDPTVGWDGTYNGKIVQAGTYSWKASIKNKNDDGRKEYTGSINVLK